MAAFPYLVSSRERKFGQRAVINALYDPVCNTTRRQKPAAHGESIPIPSVQQTDLADQLAVSQRQGQGLLVAARSHPLVVYHKDGIGTHALRFASADDKSRVEFLGNWGQFHAPDIISHYSAAAAWNSDENVRYRANRDYRLALETANFGSASFKTRNDGETANTANNAVPRSDAFWQNTSFAIDDVWSTRAKEFKANYPLTYLQIRE